jgi:hypothetical protein
MKGQSISGKRGLLARRLAMSGAVREKDAFQEKAVVLTNWNFEESDDQYFINSWLCGNDPSDVGPVNSGSPQRDLRLAAQTFVQSSRNQPVPLSTRPSDGFCPSPVSTSVSPNGLVYAGAKFNESPSPKVLPKPPLHWVGSPKVVDCGAIECVLKVMLRVQH